MGGLLLFLIFSIAPSVNAQEENPSRFRWQIFGEFAGTFSTGVSGTVVLDFFDPPGVFPVEIRRNLSKSGRFFGGLRFHLTPANQVEVSYSYNPSRLTTVAFGPRPDNQPDVSPFYVYTVSFNYVRNLPSRGRVQPFITAGVGFIAFNGPLITEYGPTGNLGMGLDVNLSKRLALRLEQRVFLNGLPQRIFISVPTNADVGGTSVNYVPSAGLVIRF